VPETPQEALIEQYCRELRMPGLRREYPALVRQATDGGWGYQDFLTHLLDVEVEARRQSAAGRCLREARLPEVRVGILSTSSTGAHFKASSQPRSPNSPVAPTSSGARTSSLLALSARVRRISPSPSP
jgi:hypothetical protein